jgi:hypothetical protein
VKAQLRSVWASDDDLLLGGVTEKPLVAASPRPTRVTEPSKL